MPDGEINIFDTDESKLSEEDLFRKYVGEYLIKNNKIEGGADGTDKKAVIKAAVTKWRGSFSSNNTVNAVYNILLQINGFKPDKLAPSGSISSGMMLTPLISDGGHDYEIGKAVYMISINQGVKVSGYTGNTLSVGPGYTKMSDASEIIDWVSKVPITSLDIYFPQLKILSRPDK